MGHVKREHRIFGNEDQIQCSVCRQWLSVEKFWTRKSKATPLYYSECKECNVKRTKEFAKNNRTKCKEYVKKSQLKTKYGITVEEYNNLLIKQVGVCAICGKEETIKMLAVDHNHETGEVRGLLCAKCNTAIGLLQDNPELLRKAAEYLEKNNA